MAFKLTRVLVRNSGFMTLNMSLAFSKMFVLSLCFSFLIANCQRADDTWVDPYDMLNYDPSTKTMRKTEEQVNYPNVPTKRREVQDSCQEDLTSCKYYTAELRRQMEDLKMKMTTISQQASSSPVFLRFLSRLLREIKKVGEPSDSTEVFYDAAISLSKQSLNELQTILDDKENRRTGALDNVLSQILVDLRPHDQEAWKWRFEDTFSVELDTVLKMALLMLVVMALVHITPWSMRSFIVMSFLVSIAWNWLYLYMIAFADHQKSMAQMSHEYEKCTGVKKITWSDSLKEWFRTTWTFQDDPCKRYYEVLMVNPVLLVPPFKAISFTITSCFTEPLKLLGQGFSDFLRALLKDLPVTMQIPGFFAMLLSFLFFLYIFVTSAFKYGLTAPLRLGRKHRPPPELEEPQERPQMIDNGHHINAGDASRFMDDDRRPQKVRQRRLVKPREAARPARVVVENLHMASSSDTEHKMDGKRKTSSQEEDLSDNDSDFEKLPDEPEELRGAYGDCAETFIPQKEPESQESKPKDKTRGLSRSPAIRVREAPTKSKDDVKVKDEETTSTPAQTKVERLGAADTRQ